MARNKAVDAWFKTYKNPMKPVVQRVREIILAADPRIEECIKWQAPTFTFEGNLASFYPKSQRHASLMFHLGARIPGSHERLEGKGSTSRVLKFESVADANEGKRELERIVQAWCEWRATAIGASARPAKKSAKKAVAKKSAKKSAKKGVKKPAKKATRQPAATKGAKKPPKKRAKKTAPAATTRSKQAVKPTQKASKSKRPAKKKVAKASKRRR